ncbi:MAG: efflux RND transporter periplasmic adaptor subunit [Betaproteobacteria bacterium]|nr:efflux RND transporter periplasmic adaptor subunit [Betaproteobacteria bacterium]
MSASPSSLSSLSPIDRSSVPRRKRSRRWIIALAVLIVAGAGFFLSGRRPAEVQVSAVQMAYPSSQYAQLTASGYVVAQRRAAVSSKAAGRLVELRVREGSAVKAGDLIARIDASDVQAAVAAAEAGVLQAQAGVRQAEATMRSAQVELANAQAEWQRARDLQNQGFVSSQALDAAARRSDAAKAGLAAAEAAIATAKGALASAQAQVKVQQVNRDQTEIRAPFDGVVLVKNANVGDMITPFSSAAGSQGAVVTVADMSTLEVEADVAESNVGKIRIDQPVEITLDALPDARFAGSVVRIVPTVDRAKATVMTKVRFAKMDPRVLPEMSAKVVFMSKAAADTERQAVVAVSPKTVVEREGKKVVFRVTDGKAEAVSVVTGRTMGDLLEVSSGPLKVGDRLVLTPSPKLEPGTSLTVAGK